MSRFLSNAFPLLILLLALFGFTVEMLDLEPRSGAVIRMAVFEQPRVPAAVVLGAWIMEACGLLALFLLAQGRCGAWWLDGLVAGWLAWIFRGPLLVLTIVVAARQPQEPWWDIALGWWILYSICGLALAILARRSGIVFTATPEPAATTAGAAEPPSTGQVEGVVPVIPVPDAGAVLVESGAPEPVVEEPDAATAGVQIDEVGASARPAAGDGAEGEEPPGQETPSARRPEPPGD